MFGCKQNNHFPKIVNILGLVWKKGTLQSDPHKIKPSKLVNNQKQLWS